MGLLERRAQVFDMSGGILSTFPWIRYIAPETSGFNILQRLNEELKNFLMVRNYNEFALIFAFSISYYIF